MDLKKAYSILVFYSILAIITATIGHFFDKKNGLIYGWIGGMSLSIFLWFAYAQKYINN
jgi:hypothetical protein